MNIFEGIHLFSNFRVLFFGLSLPFLCSGCDYGQRSVVLATKNAAIIGGTPATGMDGVLAVSGGGHCTGSVVGTHPLTIVTARHCVNPENSAIVYKDDLTLNVIESEYKDAPFNKHTGQAPGDIVVAIFNFDLKTDDTNVFSVAPVDLKSGDTIALCGFGTTDRRAEWFAHIDGILRCGKALLVRDDEIVRKSNLRARLMARDSKLNSINFSKLTSAEIVQLELFDLQTLIGEYGFGTRYGIGHFTPSAFSGDAGQGSDNEQMYSLIGGGDSGGPWYVETEGIKHLLAVTSIADVVDHCGNLSGTQVCAAGAWRVDQAWTVNLFQKAIKAGADIRGFPELEMKYGQ